MGKPNEDEDDDFEDDDLNEKYNTTWDIVTIDIKKYDGKPVYNKTFSKTKIKFYGDQNTDFHDEETSKVGSNYTCLAVATLNLVLKKMETIIHNYILKNINTSLRFRVK